MTTRAAATAHAEPMPVELRDKLRWGMTARHENNSVARLLARELTAELSASEKTALGEFLADVVHQITWGN